MIQALHQLVALLSDSSKFRKQLLEALSVINHNFGANSSLLFEFAPVHVETPHLLFERILQIPLIGRPEEYAIPDQLASIHFPVSRIDKWFKKLRQLPEHIASRQNANNDFCGNEVVFGTFKGLIEVSENIDMTGLIDTFNISEKSYVLFPLVRAGNIFGCLFFLFVEENNNWETDVIDFACSGASMITSLLKQQYTENKLELEKQILSGKHKAHTVGGKRASVEKEVAEDESSFNENVFSSIISNITPDIVFIVDLEVGEAIYCNSESFLGYEYNEMSNPLQTFINNIHPDLKAGNIKRFFEKIGRIKDEETFTHEFKVRNKNGEWVWLSERIKIYKRFPDGSVKQYFSFMQDITEKKKAFLALEKSEERYRNFVNYSSEGVYYTNCKIPIPIHLSVEEQTAMFYKNAYIEECNLIMANMYGYASEKEMIGCKIDTLHTRDFYEYNKNSFRKIVENNYRIEDEETIEFTESGEKKYFLNSGVGVIEKGLLIGMWGMQCDITEKRLAEIAFEKNELRYGGVIKDTNMGLWDWQLKSSFVEVNETLHKLLGLKKEHFLFKQEVILGLLHPDDLPVLRSATIHHVINKTDNYQMAVRFRTASNNWRWFQIYGRLVEEAADGSPKRISGMLLDVHQQKTNEILLQEGEALLKAVLDAMPDIKLHVKRDGTIIEVYSSPQAEEEQFYFNTDIKGKNLTEVMPVFTAKGLLFNVEAAINNKTLQTFEYLNVIDEITYYFEARINQVNEGEAIVILRDITSVKKTENDLNEQIYKHDQNVRELKKYIESNLQLENFAYIASHDLREPLRTMRMFGQFLKKKIGSQLDTETLSYLDFIIAGAKRMNGLIEGILAYSRVDTEPLDKEPLATEELILDSIDNLSEAIEKQNAEVVIEDIPKQIYGSKIRLEQVFQNLIANGIKFSKPNVKPRILISGRETNEEWVFKVTDNGIGINKDYYDQIFVLFKKLHNNKDFEGAGIGLALLKRIIEQHAGEIWLESEEKVGTSFMFSLSKNQVENE